MAGINERYQCPLAVLFTFLVIGATAGIIAFIVASPCRDDWPVDQNTTTIAPENNTATTTVGKGFQCG